MSAKSVAQVLNIVLNQYDV